MQRLARALGELAINGDQVLRPGDFAGDDDLVFAQAALQGQFGRFHAGQDHALVDDFLGGEAQDTVGVFLHLAHDQFLVERAAIDADAHGLAMIARDRADGGELFVAPLAGAHVAGIDAVLVQCRGRCGIFGEQHVAVVVEIADERGFAAGVQHALLDLGHGRGGFGHVHRDAHQLGASLRQLDALLRGALRRPPYLYWSSTG